MGLSTILTKFVAFGPPAHVAEARSALRRVLARRKLALNAEEEARIDACTDLTTLERWHDQAVESQSAGPEVSVETWFSMSSSRP